MPRYEKLPIIALTARAMLEDKAKCLDSGADSYLSKPVDTDVLLLQICDMIGNEDTVAK